MQLLQPGAGERAFRRTLAFFAAALLLFYMVCPAAPLRWNDLYVAYGRAAIFVMAGIYFFVCRMRGRLEVRLVIYYTIWVFLTRLLNTDYYHLQPTTDVIGVECAVADSTAGTAVIKGENLDTAALKAAVEEAGYKVTG